MSTHSTSNHRPLARTAAVPAAALVATVVALVASLIGAVPAQRPAGAAPSTGSPAMAGAEGEQQADNHGVRYLRGRAIVLDAPRRVKVKGKIRLTGDVVTRGGQRRVVVLQERRGSRWVALTRTKAARNGTHVFRVAAGRTLKTRVFRTLAPAARRLPAVRSKAVRVAVVRRLPAPPTPQPPAYDPAEGLPAGYRPPGRADDWSFLDFSTRTGVQPARWAPCTVVRWAYNPAGEAYPALADVKRAFAKVSGVSGLKFRYVGTTGYGYRGEANPSFPSNAHIFVSWAGASQFPELSGNVVGIGGGGATTDSPPSGVAYRMVVGYLTLDNSDDFVIPRGFDGPGWGQIMMHETLHALGLGHASGSDQLMAPMAGPDNYRFGAGDVQGMGQIGVRATDRCGW